jgi:hypothetical protein
MVRISFESADGATSLLAWRNASGIPTTMIER